MLASDADRDRVLEALKEGYVQGRLLHDELDQRVATALRARSLTELAALLDDLRPLPAPPRRIPAVRGLGSVDMPGPALMPWLPVVVVGIVVAGVLGSGGHAAPFIWWMVVPAFFWLRGGRRRYRYRGPRQP